MSASAQTHETALAEVVIFVVTHLPAGTTFKGRFLLGSERWRSGACLMCAATLVGSDTPRELLLKFFASDADFDREVEVAGKFQAHCPVVYGVFPASFDDPEYDEDRVPACMAIERPLCTLQEWLAQKDIDWLLSDQIATLYCISAMLRDLHARDLVLCDLSPTTLAWFDSGDRPPGWRLLTASQMLRRGRHGRPVVTMHYAAPEVAATMKERQAQDYVLASPSIDVWCLGVIGLEIFTGKGLFEQEHSQEQIRMMLCHDEPLPFERDKSWWGRVKPPAAAGLLRNLLQRNPLLRLMADDVLRVIHMLASAPDSLEEGQQDDTAAGLRSSDDCVQQLAPWPTTWSSNFSSRLQTFTGGGSEMNTETAAVGRMQAQMLNARLSASMAADLLTSRDHD